MTPLLIALQFLTRLPVRLPGMPEPQQIGRSLLFYPLVGLLLGLALLIALHLATGGEQARLGLAVSRKVDKRAVGRNRIKRVLRDRERERATGG